MNHTKHSLDANLSIDTDRGSRTSKIYTAGMSLYGNRARTSVMLPLDLARVISKEAKERNCTVNQVIVEMLVHMQAGAQTQEH